MPPGSAALPSRRRRRRALAIGAATILAALFLAEAALRGLDLPGSKGGLRFLGGVVSEKSFVEDPRLFWRLREGDTEYAGNPAGMRGFWPTRPKRAPDLRIVCVGDSSTFGVFLRLEETYGLRLERRLQEDLPHRNVQTILAALPGYTTHQNRIFLERHVDALAPDVTVLYCGAWNDPVPAIGLTDSERARRIARPRILRLFEDAFGDAPLGRKVYAEAHKEGRAPHGRRVPLPEFQANLEALVRAGRKHGGRVVAILPPAPAATLRDFPVLAEYTRVQREVFQALDVPWIDGTALLSAFEDGCPEPWRSDAPGESIGFTDWIHPSALGHELLAEALFEELTEGLVEGLGTAPAPEGFRTRRADLWLSAQEPIRALVATTALMEAGEPAALRELERIWIGDHEVPFERESSGAPLVRLPATLRPGEHALCMTTALERLLANEPVRVNAIPVRAELEDVDGEPCVAVEVDVPLGWSLLLWMSDALRPEPLATRFGPFHLAADPDGHHPERPELPFLFRRLTLPRHDARADASGRVRTRFPLPSTARGAPPRLVHLQGGAFDPQDPRAGTLTDVVTLELGR